ALDGAGGEPGRHGDAREPAGAHLALRLHRRAVEGRRRGSRNRARGAWSRGRRGPHGGRRPRAGGRLTVSNETVLTLGLLALAVYFSVLIARGLAGYRLFLKVRPTALLTWPVRRPTHFPFLLALGVVAAALAVIRVRRGAQDPGGEDPRPGRQRGEGDIGAVTLE